MLKGTNVPMNLSTINNSGPLIRWMNGVWYCLFVIVLWTSSKNNKAFSDWEESKEMPSLFLRRFHLSASSQHRIGLVIRSQTTKSSVDLTRASLTEVSALLRAGDLSSEEVWRDSNQVPNLLLNLNFWLFRKALCMDTYSTRKGMRTSE